MGNCAAYNAFNLSTSILCISNLEARNVPPHGVLVCVALLLAARASAATYTVLPNGGGDFVKIQDAIDAAVSGDVIVLGNGTFLGPRNRDLLFLGKNLTLRSQSGNPALCTIDCEGQSRGLNVTQGETDVLIQGITIRNGFHPGIPGTPGAPGWGGGFNLLNATVTFRFCVITQCGASDVTGSAIGAGGYANNSRVTLEDCAFVENSFATRGTGGGLFAWGNSNVTATRCQFAANRAPGISGHGGGISVQDSRLTLVDCDVVGNMAEIGAGISTGQLCIVDFRNCLVAGNSNNTAEGSAQAAGIQIGYDTDGSIVSCTIVGNRAYNRGAGMSVANDCNLMIEKTVIWGKCIGAGQGESVYSQADGMIDFLCCDVDPAKVIGGTKTYTSSFASDPQFCNPKPCANAPTLEGNYSLRGTSPLLDAVCGVIGSEAAICDVIGVRPGPRATNGLRLRSGPNPFRDAASLHYTIAEAGPVEVALFDAVGRLVMHFDEGSRAPGSYTIRWDGFSKEGTRAPAGAYFARLRSRGLVATDWIFRVE